MGRLQAIARSIVRAVIKDVKKRSRSPIAFILGLLSTIFSFYELPLHKHRPEVFSELCQKYWNLDDEEYVASFRGEEGARPEDALMTMGDLGFSGSVCDSDTTSIRDLTLTRSRKSRLSSQRPTGSIS